MGKGGHIPANPGQCRFCCLVHYLSSLSLLQLQTTQFDYALKHQKFHIHLSTVLQLFADYRVSSLHPWTPLPYAHPTCSLAVLVVVLCNLLIALYVCLHSDVLFQQLRCFEDVAKPGLLSTAGKQV